MEWGEGGQKNHFCENFFYLGQSSAKASFPGFAYIIFIAFQRAIYNLILQFLPL